MRISESIKNVFKLSFGTIMGQAITFVALPIFTRIFGAVVIGQWAYLNSISIIINSFSDLGLINAIMIEDNEKNAGLIYKVVSTLSMLVSLVAGGVFTLYQVMTSGYSNHILIQYVIICFWSFTLQQIQICYAWLNRKKEYDVLMKNPIINNVTSSIVAILLGLIGFKEYGYHIGMLIGQLLTLLHMKMNLPRGIFTFKLSNYKYCIINHKDFVKYQLPSTIMLQIKSQLPTLLFSEIFGQKILGYYSLSMRVLNIPINFLGNSIGKIYFRTASELRKDIKKLGEFTLKSLDYAMKFCTIPIVILLSLSDIIFTIIFGSEYTVAGNFTRLMTFYGFFMFLSMSTSGVAIVSSKQKYLLFSGAIQIITTCTSFLLGMLFNSPYVALILMSITYIIIQVVYFCAILKYSDIKISIYISHVFKSIVLIMFLYIIFRYFLIIIVSGL